MRLATTLERSDMSTHHERAVRVLEGRVRSEDRVVGLDDRVGHARGRVHAELELGLLAIVGRETFQKQGTET